MKQAPRAHVFLCITASLAIVTASDSGQWRTLQPSIGVSAMHMQLLHNDRVIVFDRTDFGPSNLSLPDGRCRTDAADQALTTDCTAHSVEYDVAANSFRPLTVRTDTWCSSGTVEPGGSLVQMGGFNDGERVARTMPACGDEGDGVECDWTETTDALLVRRWYASSQVLPDGRAIIVGGRRQFSYEFFPKSDDAADAAVVALPFLRQTKDPEENNLYPFLHFNIDGNLFVFANNRAILLDVSKNKVVRTYPVLGNGDPRSYPSTGSSVLLPLSPSPSLAEVLVCGGAPKGAYSAAQNNGTFIDALTTCGRLRISDTSPAWVMETMPTPRVMGDMVLLPSGGEVLIINGAMAGAAGWENGRHPALAPVVYRPGRDAGDRFDLQSAAATARLYHSSAVLLRDGRVLVGGSNPHVGYIFRSVEFPTELGLDVFSPDYLSPENAALRPTVESDGVSATELNYGQKFFLRFALPTGTACDDADGGALTVTMVAPAFATHSFSMNQRLLILNTTTAPAEEDAGWVATATAPATAALAPPGYYMLFVVNAGVPSEGKWAHIQ